MCVCARVWASLCTNEWLVNLYSIYYYYCMPCELSKMRVYISHSIVINHSYRNKYIHVAAATYLKPGVTWSLTKACRGVHFTGRGLQKAMVSVAMYRCDRKLRLARKFVTSLNVHARNSRVLGNVYQDLRNDLGTYIPTSYSGDVYRRVR